MRRKRVVPEVVHVMADGKVLSHEEFMAKPYEVIAEDNYEFHVKCNQAFDPKYHAKEQMRRRYAYAQQRRAELEAQRAEISAQLEQMTT